MRGSKNFGIALVLNRIVAWQQPTTFGSLYAAYGIFFILMAILWEWLVDGMVIARFDFLEKAIAFLGTFIIVCTSKN